MLNNTYNRVIVTGSNKGIGYEVVKLILQNNMANNVVICSRDMQRGKDAINSLVQMNSAWEGKLDLGILDLNSKESISAFKDWYVQKYQTVDCIVNNAGYAQKGPAFDKEIILTTFKCNFDGTCFFQQAMSSVMSPGGKVIFVASMAGSGSFRRISSRDLQNKFLDKELNFRRLLELKSEMIADWDAKTFESKGWPGNSYGLSKMFLMFAAGYAANLPEYIDRNIQMYTMCPGWCKSDMAGWDRAPKTAEEGADTVIW